MTHQLTAKASVKRADDVEAQNVTAGARTTLQMLIGPDEGPHFALRRFIMQPGGGMPKHTNTVEHEQYVLRGSARVGIGDAIYDVQPGDVVFIPAGTPHWYEAGGTEPFEFLCVVPNLPDTIDVVRDG